MEFWGVEVKGGVPLKVELGDDKLLHLSQASLGEVKEKGTKSIPLLVKINGQKFVIGRLSLDKCTQISYDLVFEKEFELSHNWKNGSVYFCGYKSIIPDEFDDNSSKSDEEYPIIVEEHGKLVQKVDQSKSTKDKANDAKPYSSASKPNVENMEQKDTNFGRVDEDAASSDDGDDIADFDSEDDIETPEGSTDNDEMLEDESLKEESPDEDDEATTKKPELGRKRPAESASKTAAFVKKARLVTPQKTGPGGKMGGDHIATPHPSKQVGKTLATSNNLKPLPPKSVGQVSCKSCNRKFGSDSALQAHTKAKHSGGK